MKTSKKGISLIVLVITIIVMIILSSAIILSLSSGDIRVKANEAVSSNDISTAKEIVSVARSEWEINYDELKDNYNGFEDYATEKLEKSGINYVSVSNDGAVNIIYTDKNGDKAIIPEGFVASSATGEDIIENGLVIYKGTEEVTDDNVAVAQETRDQFVWVPVPNMKEFIIRDGYSKGVPQTLVADGSITEPFSYDTKITEANDLTGEYSEYSKMKESVTKYGGFYIGRYETGTSEPRTSTSSVTDVLVQKNKYVYNYAFWGDSMTEVGTTGMVYLARRLYNTNSVKSTLCYGVQWDATINFMKDIENPNVEGKKYIEDSTGMGWYSNNYVSGNPSHKTGIDMDSNKSNMVKNIYDMGGNVWECAMESYKSRSRVRRGGAYFNTAEIPAPASMRSWGVIADSSAEGIGFRITLYIK